MKIGVKFYRSHNPYDEGHRVSRLRENLTSGSEGEGLETDQKAPRQSFTRQEDYKAIKAKIRDIIRNSGATPAKEIISKINIVLAGWVNYFRIGNSSRAFSEVRDYVEMKVRTLLTRRKRRQKRSIGWRRWSNEYLYNVLGLYWDWKIYPLKNAEAYK